MYFREAHLDEEYLNIKDKKDSRVYKIECELDLFVQFDEKEVYSAKKHPLLQIAGSLKAIPMNAEKPEKGGLNEKGNLGNN